MFIPIAQASTVETFRLIGTELNARPRFGAVQFGCRAVQDDPLEVVHSIIPDHTSPHIGANGRSSTPHSGQQHELAIYSSSYLAGG
jgi:hypothetical protein